MTNKTTNNSALESVLKHAAQDALKPQTARRGSTPRPCAGGCGNMTRGGQWYPGHDGRVHGRSLDLMRRGATVEEVADHVTCSEGWDANAVMAQIMAARDQAQTA